MCMSVDLKSTPCLRIAVAKQSAAIAKLSPKQATEHNSSLAICNEAAAMSWQRIAFMVSWIELSASGKVHKMCIDHFDRSK